jgi:hypothetical protein
MMRAMADKKEPGGARDVILARRKFFVASALAGVAFGCSGKKPNVCLDMAQPAPETSTQPAPVPQPTGAPQPTGEPQVCLSAPAPCLDMPPPEPTVCLDVPPPQPHVCLEFADPKRKNR